MFCYYDKYMLCFRRGSLWLFYLSVSRSGKFLWRVGGGGIKHFTIFKQDILFTSFSKSFFLHSFAYIHFRIFQTSVNLIVYSLTFCPFFPFVCWKSSIVESSASYRRYHIAAENSFQFVSRLFVYYCFFHFNSISSQSFVENVSC
jgi:hypothetical protein